MKHGKLYWLSVVATMLIAVGCDESSTSTICTDNTRNCDDVEGATNKCANGKCSSTCKEGYGELNGSCLPAMISTWEVTSNNLHLLFPIQGRAGAIVIDWGDGTRSKIDSGDAGYISHAYLNTGIYVITVFGTIEKWSCGNDQNMILGCHDRKACDGLISIRSFGNVTFGICAFAYTPKLESFPAKGTPKFYNNDASYAFYRSSFNNDISGWDTSSITNMSHMFQGAWAFNQPIENWDVSSVTDMSYMFSEAYMDAPFNQYVRSSSVFNQPLNNWNVSNVTNMSHMFWRAKAFDQPLDNWDVSNVTNMGGMFAGASAFNQPLNNWNVSNVTNMGGMFDAEETSQLTSDTYQGIAPAFNQPLNDWDVSNVTDMSYMFRGASAFNQPLNNWNVSNVTNMSYMFEKAEAFNQPLNNWDVSNVTNMYAMFKDASAFNQPLDNWNVSNIETVGWYNIGNMFTNSGLNQENYCKTVKGPYSDKWSKADLGLNYVCE